jgi:hypothetical protein
MSGSDVQSGRWFREGGTLVLRGAEPTGFPSGFPAGFRTGLRPSRPVPAVLDEITGKPKPTPPPAPAPAAAPAPVRLAHFHIRKAPDPSHGGVLKAAAAATVMTPAAMKPGYVLPADPKRKALQTALVAMLRSKFASALSPAVNLRVALVDLTGAKRHAPVFSGFSAWGPGAAFEGGSLVKILALYAVYQLRFDLDTSAAQQGITKASALQSSIKAEWAKRGLRAPPDLNALFCFHEAPGKTVTAHLIKIHDIHSNAIARELILNLGFEYIGSVALQSGLFEPTEGGLWLNAAYGTPAVTWTTSPFPKLERHNVTALAAATFFTLLAQGRLVSQEISREIGTVLAMRVCMDNGALEGIQKKPCVRGSPENKCGILAPFFHEAFHVVRQIPGGKRLDYAVAVLSKEPPTVSFIALGKELDKLIAAAN